MKKRILSVLLCLCMVLTCIPTMAFALQTVSEGSYQVTLELNGGTLPDGTDITEYMYGDEITLPTPSRTGYIFEGWCERSNMSTKVTEIRADDSGDKVFLANWTLANYTVTVESDGHGTASYEIATPSISGSIIAGDKILLHVSPEKGYHFKEWQVIYGGVTIERDTFYMGGESVFIKAIFERNVVENPFGDISRSDWFYDDVMYIYENKMMNGMSDTTFEPSTVLNRSMMMTILWRMNGRPTPNGAATFSDVEVGAWYADAVAWAQQNNISNGIGNNKFGVNDSITREQMMTMFHRYAQYKGRNTAATADLSVYSDAGSISSYAEVPMQWAVGCGLMYGRTTTTLAPKGTATRAEAAAIMHRFDTIVNVSTRR